MNRIFGTFVSLVCPDSSREFSTSSDCENILEEFRALGGVAENIALELHGHSEPGLFAADPARPLILHVPDNLLFRVSDVEFVDDALRIRNSAGLTSGERDFFARYQKALSWGTGGRSEAAMLIAMFDALPVELREILAADFAMQDFMEGEHIERMRRHFLTSRAVMWKGEPVLVPFIELAKRSGDGIPLDSEQDGYLQIKGQYAGEILVAFGSQDPLGVFRKFGVASARPHAFSLPVRTRVGTTDLTITRNLAAEAKRAGFDIPEVKWESGELFLSHLMLGHSTFPRASRGIFYTLMREAGVTGAQEGFDRVLQFNKGAFLGLLERLEPLQGEMITRLRRMAHFQLEALAHCVGAREL